MRLVFYFFYLSWGVPSVLVLRVLVLLLLVVLRLLLLHGRTHAEELGLFTDASLEGFGASFVLPDGTCEVFSGRWDEVMPGIDTSQATKEWNISELELLVVIMAMTQWSKHLAQRRVVMRCDNAAAVSVANTGHARDGAMSALLRELWYVKARGSFEMQAKHVKTHDNQLGDIPSRWTRPDGSRDVEAETELYEHLAEHYGVAAEGVHEVAVAADTAGLLRRMQKAHRRARRDAAPARPDDGDDGDDGGDVSPQ